MAVKHRLRAEQLQVGAPLPADVYDAENRLLLRRGNVIATASQLQRLIDSGLYSTEALPMRAEAQKAKANERDDPFVNGPLMRPSVSAAKPRRLSVYSELTQIAHTLEALLKAPETKENFVADIWSMAQNVRQHCTTDADAALAHIHFAAEVCYPVRQANNVAIVTALLLERMKNDPVRSQSAVCAALTMNISICDLLQQLYQQQALNPEHQAALTQHPVTSARKLASIGVTDAVWLALVEQHHEFIDGTGYPNKLSGNAMAVEAQVIGLADRYCSAVTERAYRLGVAPGVVMKQIREKSGTAINPKLISALLYWVGIYPPGTVVELFNRDLAVVTRRLQDLKSPVVYAVAGDNHQPFVAPRRRSTGTQPQFRIERVMPREIIKFPVDPEILWPRTSADSPLAVFS